MKTYIQSLRNYIQENKIVFDPYFPDSCLDALWWHYGEYHNGNSDAARQSFRALRAQLESLSFLDSDSIFSTINCLCAEHERLAFTAGLRLGAQLMLEASDYGAGNFDAP